MLLNSKKIKISQKRLLKNLEKIREKSNLHYIGSDSTRLKIIFLLKLHKELCPTDFALILNISMSAISHQLRLLKREDIVKGMKMGKIICYMITEKGRKF